MSAGGAPRPVGGRCAWRGPELAADDAWRFALDEAEIEDLERALAHARARGRGPLDVVAADFPLPRLEPKLARIARELEDGRGLVRIRGVPVARWSRDDVELAWMGLAAHVGTPVSQSAHGQRLREIRDEGADVGARYGQLATGDGTFLSSRARTASTAGLRWHTDRCDVVALLCTGRARSGGASRVASAVAVHDAMLARRPDLAALLYRDLPRSRIGEESGGEAMWYPLPVWGVRDGKFTSHYSRTYVEAGQLVDGVPRVSAAQWEALDLLAELAEELAYDMELDVGDVQLLNNHVVYHARDEFEDDPAAGLVRCLLRVWLCVPSRALPAGHEVLWRATEPGEPRGGIAVG